MRRRWIDTLSLAGIFTVTVGLGIAGAQGSSGTRDSQRPPAPSAGQPSGDHAFVAQVAMANMAAIQLGHLATKKTQNAEVQKFAQATIDDHLKAQRRLADAAYGAGIQWPTKLDDPNRQLQERLSKLNKDQFDREYMKAVIERHRDVEKLLAARVGDGDSRQPRSQPGESSLGAKVNQWAETTLPEIRAHLKAAEQVFGQLDRGE